MKLIRCDNCKTEDDCLTEPFDDTLTTIKGQVRVKDAHYGFTVHICGDCMAKIFKVFPDLKKATELF